MYRQVSKPYFQMVVYVNAIRCAVLLTMFCSHLHLPVNRRVVTPTGARSQPRLSPRNYALLMIIIGIIALIIATFQLSLVFPLHSGVIHSSLRAKQLLRNSAGNASE